MAQKRLVVLAAVAVAFSIVGCSEGDADEREALEERVTTLLSDADALAEQVEQLEGEVETLSGDLSATSASLDEAEQQAEEMAAELEVATEKSDEAEAERDEAIAQAEALRIRFDPEIQAAIAGAQSLAAEQVCSAGDAYGFEGTGERPDPEAISAGVLDALPDGVQLDLAALEARLNECIVAGEGRAALVALVQPKGDGLWTVGLEIAAGLWRSTGQGDGCYWQRSPDGRPDDIIDNHFGNAGGSVTLRDGEEFETSRCGTWEFAG